MLVGNVYIFLPTYLPHTAVEPTAPNQFKCYAKWKKKRTNNNLPCIQHEVLITTKSIQISNKETNDAVVKSEELIS
jgi:hypothetical protein